jgi:hypothetical protein
MRKLQRQGVGYRAIAAASDVARTVVMEIRSGKKRRCRAGTVRAILAVGLEQASDGALVDAGPTRRRIMELLREGFTKAQLARRFGLETGALQFPLGDRITARNAHKVERLCRALLMED